MNPDSRVVVVGAGQAGAWVVAGLRNRGLTGPVVLIGDETHPPYERPPLSKEYLRGQVAVDGFAIKKSSFYADHDVQLLLNSRATAIDRGERRVVLDDAPSVPYDYLVLATGSRPRTLALPGASKVPLHCLRTIADADALRAALADARRVVVIGGGLIGMEIAAAAVAAGKGVVVLEAAPSVMGRVLPDVISERLADLHRARGVEIRTGVRIEGFDVGDAATRVMTDGGEIEADAVVVGIGVVPNAGLALDAGLDVGDGIVVDEFGTTSDPLIYAAGDAAWHRNVLLGRHLRLESWHHAQQHGLCVGGNVGLNTAPYREVPWSWSDQYDTRLEIAGAPSVWPELVLRHGDGNALIAFALEGDTLVGAVSIDDPRNMRVARKLMALERPVDRAALQDSSQPLAALATAAA